MKQKKQQTKHEQQEQLQISEFIKDPSTLKLLILAGTNIKSSELSTVAKCTNLIKLDLSGNMLSDIPITFSNFIQLKILYLHDNNIFSLSVSNSTVEYVTLFNNPFKDYRKNMVQGNEKLLALDYNIVTPRERMRLTEPAPFTQIKWPIVEASASLQNQEDYLNLLKAQIFVITNLYKKAINVEKVQTYITGFNKFFQYGKLINSMTDEMKIRKSCVLEAVNQWKNYMKKKEKLREFLKTKGQDHLLLNNMDVRKLKRSPRTNEVIGNFMTSIRQRLQARKKLEPVINSYRQFIPTLKMLNEIYRRASSNSQTQKLYFLQSQLHFLDKIFLYVKRLLFNKKQYDLCDNFQKLVIRSKRELFVFRIKQRSERENSFLLESIRRTINLVCGEKNLDRRHFLYTKKGHKHIGLKSRDKLKLNISQSQQLCHKINQTYSKVSSIYDMYDSLICFEINDRKLFDLLIKIIRYFNSGNSDVILSNQTAYFQTQVVFENQQNAPKKEKMFVGLEFFVKRTLAANVIQKFWRRIRAKQQSSIDLIQSLREKRAKSMISHWLRYLPFHHRIQANKELSYRKTMQKTTDIYIQLDIYMRLPILKNILKISIYEPLDHAPNEILFHVLHQGTYVQIIEICQRKWVRIIFPSIEKAVQAYKLFMFTTFRFFYNGFYLQLFSYFEAQQQLHLQKYEKKVKQLFKIDVSVSKPNVQSSVVISKKLPIQNSNPYFIWAQIGQKGIEMKFQMQKGAVPLSMFVYNKHQKPLKINCEVNWLNPSSIYFNKRQVLKQTSFYSTSIRSRTPTKKSLSSSKKDSFILGQDVAQHYVTKMRSSEKRDRRSSQISPHSTLLLKNHRFRSRGSVTDNIQVDLLSQTLMIKKK